MFTLGKMLLHEKLYSIINVSRPTKQHRKIFYPPTYPFGSFHCDKGAIIQSSSIDCPKTPLTKSKGRVEILCCLVYLCHGKLPFSKIALHSWNVWWKRTMFLLTPTFTRWNWKSSNFKLHYLTHTNNHSKY